VRHGESLHARATTPREHATARPEPPLSRCSPRPTAPNERAAASVLADAEAKGADLAALRENLARTPAERLAELVEMNRFHAAVQARTLTPAMRAALEEREREVARARLGEVAGAGA